MHPQIASLLVFGQVLYKWYRSTYAQIKTYGSSLSNSHKYAVAKHL